jgi:hypothetical protein
LRYKEGQVAIAERKQVEYAHLDAELRLEREKSKPGRKPVVD